MGRFSCFYGHMQSHKHKKPSQPSFEEMVKMLQPGNNNPDSSAKSTTPMMDDYEAKSLSCDSEHASLSPHGWKSDYLKCECHAEGSTNSTDFGVGNFRRSLSVGCELGQKRRIYKENNPDDCIDHECYFNSSHGFKTTARSSSPIDRKSTCTTSQESYHYVSRHDLSSSMMNHESNISVDEPRLLEKEDRENTNAPLHMACGDKTDRKTTDTISKCYSMPNFESFEDLNIQDDNDEGSSSPHHDASALGMTQSNRDDDDYNKSERVDGEEVIFDRFESYNYSCSNKDWIVPEPDEITGPTHEETVFSPHQPDRLPNLDFKVKRIEDWVSDLQHCSPVDGSEEVVDNGEEVKRCNGFIDGIDATRASCKVNPGVEAAKKYISSLNASTNTAHLANHGLVVVPLLSAFVGLKVLNLSGNSIVRITAGALPRGLHMLNLSKNKISAIEGLKELTRVRVLDLSYNKISRIGHGLASCSSLKELYLAGNKISEVEGLHRLLKLSVLDLRFNKIATTKCLGQLAANYNSLQAISLEGNPAQKNVGDEQLKKYLQSLLPQLSYYNRQHIKSSTSKDSSDRSVRLGISGHKSSPRRGGNSLKQRTSSSSNLAQKGVNIDSPKQSRGRRGLPSGTRTSTSRHHRVDVEKERELRRLKVGFEFHKSRSEGMLVGLEMFSSPAGACENNS